MLATMSSSLHEKAVALSLTPNPYGRPLFTAEEVKDVMGAEGLDKWYERDDKNAAHCEASPC